MATANTERWKRVEAAAYFTAGITSWSTFGAGVAPYCDMCAAPINHAYIPEREPPAAKRRALAQNKHEQFHELDDYAWRHRVVGQLRSPRSCIPEQLRRLLRVASTLQGLCVRQLHAIAVCICLLMISIPRQRFPQRQG